MSFFWAYGSIENGANTVPEDSNKGSVMLDLSLPQEPSGTTPEETVPEETAPEETSPEQQTESNTIIPEEKERPKPLRSESFALCLNSIFSVLFFAGVVLHLS